MNKKLPKSLYEILVENRDLTYQNITPSQMEKAITELFYNKTKDNLDIELDELFKVDPKTDEEVKQIISNPESGYNKLLKGYVYSVYSDMILHTGLGGAQFMYKNLLKEGMEEDMIEQIIYVHFDRTQAYPLAALKIKDAQ